MHRIFRGLARQGIRLRKSKSSYGKGLCCTLNVYGSMAIQFPNLLFASRRCLRQHSQ